MESGLMEILRKRTFDFASLAAGGSGATILGEFDLSCFGDATLLVRVHDNSTTGTSSIVVALYTISESPDDPLTTFASTSPVASVTIDGSTADGELLVAGLGEAFGRRVQLRVTGTRNGGDTARADISSELVRRRGIAAPRRSLSDTLAVGNSTGGRDLIVTSGDELVPELDDSDDLGNAGARWRTMHAGTSVRINNHPAAKVVEALQISMLRI
jgi:hypothetical protein